MPAAPIIPPLIRKIRITLPRLMPMVRRIAISPVLALTSMYWPLTMLKAATRMMRERMRNMTLRSTLRALVKAVLASLPINEAPGLGEGSLQAGPQGRCNLGALGEDLDRVDAVAAQEALRFAQGGDDEAAVVFVEAEGEGAGDLKRPLARQSAENGAVAVRVEERDPVAGGKIVALGQALAQEQAASGEGGELVLGERGGDLAPLGEVFGGRRRAARCRRRARRARRGAALGSSGRRPAPPPSLAGGGRGLPLRPASKPSGK